MALVSMALSTCCMMSVVFVSVADPRHAPEITARMISVIRAVITPSPEIIVPNQSDQGGFSLLSVSC